MSEVEVKYKLAPGVMCCPCKTGTGLIEDFEHRTALDFEEDDAEQRVKDGYLVRVKDPPIKEKNTK